MIQYTRRSNLFYKFYYHSYIVKELGEFNLQRLRHARKSRELENLKIHVNLGKFCLSYTDCSDGFILFSRSATYQQITPGTSSY